MKKIYFLIFGIAILAFSAILVLAQEDDPFADIVYPIAELGNCTDKDDCLNYCDNPDNMEACLDFAEDNNLLPEDEIVVAKKMLEATKEGGPGGCKGKAECETYCDDINNLDECIIFAEKNNLMPPEKLAEGKKMAQALKQGLTPPNNCKSKEECNNYCNQPGNMKECITFAKEADLIPPEELAEAEKVLAAIEKGVMPPPCGGKEACDEYCAAPENFETCIAFGEAAGFVSPEEAAMARKTGGRGPGDCRGREQCEAFCEDPANGEECINFAIENGFMSPEEAEQAKKMLAAGVNMMQGGPGGCKGREECESFCNDENNMEECANFAIQSGMMSPEEAEMMRQMGSGMKQGGPGGCKGREECESFCNDENNMEECLDFGQRSGMMRPEEAQRAGEMMETMQRGGPGGCRGGQECQDYCEDSSHLEECSNFAEQQGIISPDEAQRMMERRGGEEFPQEGFPGEEMPQGMPFEEGMPPGEFGPEGMPREFEQFQRPEFEGQVPEQFQQQYQQQFQQQFQQPPAEQLPPIQQFSPPPTTEQPPQSFWDRAKNFLAGTGLIIGK